MRTDLVIVLLGLTVITLFGGVGYIMNSDIETTTVQVESKERQIKRDSDGSISEERLIFTDKGVYMVHDNPYILHFRSLDVWGDLKENSRCQVAVTGFRAGYLSIKPNIVEAKCN